MPLSLEAWERLENFREVSGDFALFGLFINPITGEMGTYSSHGLAPEQVMEFLQRAVNQMLEAAANGELEYVGESNGAKGKTTQTYTGGNCGTIH